MEDETQVTEADLKQLEDSLNAHLAGYNLAFINGQLYNVDLSPCPAQTVAAKITQSLLYGAGRLRRQLTAEVDRLRAELDNVVAMPNVTLGHVKAGVRVYRDGSEIGVIVPIRYAPKYLINKSDGVTYKIPDRFYPKLHRDVMMVAKLYRGKPYEVVLLNAKLELFYQYHGAGESNCLGTLSGDVAALETIDDILQFAKRYEKVLETINGKSLYNEEPAGMPSYSTLVAESTERVAVSGWTTDNQAYVDDPSAVHSKVYVKLVTVPSGQRELTPFLEAIGRVERVSEDGRLVGISYLDPPPVGSDNVDGLVYVPAECVRAVPNATRRTRIDPKFTRKFTTKDGRELYYSEYVRLLKSNDSMLKWGIRDYQDAEDMTCRVCGRPWAYHSESVCSLELRELEGGAQGRQDDR